MSRLIKERLKTICIFILVTTGLLQVGIQWSYQSQGTPTSFLSGLFNHATQISAPVARERLFVPDKLILSDGGKSHWILSKDDAFYKDLWEEAKQGLDGIASGRVSMEAISEEWGSVVEKRGFLIDFGYPLKPELLKWFLGDDKKKQELPDVRKIVVKPDIVDDNISTFYIYSTDGTVYISEPISNERKDSLEEILSSVKENLGQKYRNYRTFTGGKIDIIDAEPDVLYAFVAPRYWPYFEYTSKPPAKAGSKDEIAAIILGAEKDRYYNSTDNENTIQFSNENNIYRYYADGYLTYSYLGNIDSTGKGEVGEALLNAYKFVTRINEKSEIAADIVLTSVQEEQPGIFNFNFDYRLNGMPVKVIVNKKDENGEELAHAINIQADSKRVLKCDWLLRDFVQGEKGSYNDRFIEVAAKAGIKYSEVEIQDMNCGYFIDSASINVLKPMLLIDRKDESTLPLELPEEGD